MKISKIKKITQINYSEKLYDISLDVDHHYYSRTSHASHYILTHNCDIVQGGREKVREYLESKYGKNAVAGVMTNHIYQPKSALQDCSRGLGKDTSFTSILMREITKLDGLEETRDLRAFFNSVKLKVITPTTLKWINENEEVIYWAQKMLGLVKNIGTHAGGIIVTDGPLYNYIPVTRGGKEVVTAFKEADGSSKDLSELGLLKLDILGVKTLNVIQDSIKQIKEDLNIDITSQVKHINLEDKNLYEKFNKGNNIGIFQFSGMTAKKTENRS